MGNTTSQQGSQARGVQSPGRASSTARTSSSSPAGRTRSPLGPHRSLKTKKKSLELPDLASLAFTPSHSGTSTPYRRGGRTSSPIPIPTSAGPQSTAPRPQLPSTSEMPDVLLPAPSTHIPLYPANHRPRSQHMRGAPLPYNSTRSFSGQSSQPFRAPRSDSSEFVQQVIRSSIPLVLHKHDTDYPNGVPRKKYKEDEPVPTKITWTGGADKSVVLTRAGDDNWKGRQPMELDPATGVWSAIVNLLPGTHHIKFIVDEQWRTTEDMPTAAADDGSLANYMAVHGPLSAGSSPPALTFLRASDPERAKLNGGISFWSADDNESVSSFDGGTDGVRVRDGHWTDEFPPALIAAAREEELYLASQEQEDSLEYSGPTQRMPAPNVPPAPVLPRFLEKLILNARAAAPPAPAKSKEKERDKDKDKRKTRDEHGRPIPVTTASGTDVSKVHAIQVGTIQPASPVTGRSRGQSTSRRDRERDRESPTTEASGHSDDASVLPVPSHVVLHHLSTSAIKNGVLAVANTTRYRAKYLTTIYYKPT